MTTSIHVEFISSLVKIVNERQVQLEINAGSVLKDVLDALQQRFGEEFEEMVYSSKGIVRAFVIILVNGIDIRSLQGLDTPVHEGDKILLIPAIAGG